MHVPAPNAVDDPEVVASMLRATGFGHLVTASTAAGGPSLDATPLPFLVDHEVGDAVSKIRAHVARANPHWRALDGCPALLIVPVTDAYVSPSWYPTKATDPRVVPTWNYEVVYVHGTTHVHDDPAFCARVVRQLTDRHERRRVDRDGRPGRWSVDDAPADFIDRQLRAIVGISLVVERVVAKRKLSQNRGLDDRTSVAAALRASADARDRSVGSAMQSLDE